MFSRNLHFAAIISLVGCTAIDIDRTTSSAWYYERYKPVEDRTVILPSGPARVLVFNEVNAAFPIYDNNGNEIGHAHGWRTEIEIFFPKDQLPEDALEAAKLAAVEACRSFKHYDTLEEHAHYIRLAAEC